MFLRGIYFAPDDGGAAGGAAAGGGDPAAAAAAAAGGAPAGGGQQQQQLSLRAQLAEAFETPEEKEAFRKRAEKFATDKDFAKSMHHMSSTYDQRVPLPGADSKPEDWHKLYTRLGKPETANDYKFEWGEERLDDAGTARYEAFKKFAHDEHLTQKQFEGLVKLNQTFNGQDLEAASGQLDNFQLKTTELLRKEWGADFEANLEYGRTFGSDFADSPEEWKAAMDLTIMGPQGAMRVGDHPTLLKAFAKVGRMFSEDARIRSMEKSGETESIQAKIAEIEERAAKENKSTSQEPFHSQLAPLYAKLYPKKHKVGIG